MEQTSITKKELDVLDIVQILWERRRVVVATTLGFLVASLLFTSTKSPVYRGELEIFSLDKIDLAGFDAWNERIEVVESFSSQNSKPHTTKVETQTKSSLQSLKVTGKDLEKTFRAQFARKTDLVAALLEHSSAVQNFNGNELEFNNLLNSLLAKFVLSEDQNGRLFISTETKDKAETTLILARTLALISTNAKQNIMGSIRSVLDARTVSHELELKRIDGEFDALTLVYSAKKKRSLAFMREQASIARKLGLQAPFMASSPVDGQSSIISADWNKLGPFESSYFLQGYEAIEQQIANIQRREDGENGLFVEGVDTLIIKRAVRCAKCGKTSRSIAGQLL